MDTPVSVSAQEMPYMKTKLLMLSQAVDVNIYASNARHTQALIGNHENTEVGEFIRDYLDLDLKPITDELMSKGVLYDTVSATGETISWTGKPPDVDGLDELDHYHGNFKRDSFEHKMH